jgi:1,4-alpha-glucan branching enzyme
MGQEWVASSPFLYYTDHATELGRKVVDGRRREFEKFSPFRDPSTREQIPSPQASETFASSRLDWAEREHQPHLGVWRLYRRCLELRRHLLARAHANEARDHVTVEDCGDDTVVLRYRSERAELVVVSRLRGAGAVTVAGLPAQASVMLTTEDAAFAPGGLMPKIESSRVTFSTPATVVFAFTR